MSLKIWTLDSCDLLAISDKGATGADWEISSYGSPRFFYMGETLSEAPLAIYYGTTKLTKVTGMTALATQNTWLWGDYDSIGRSTIYVNCGESIETAGSDIVYRSQLNTVIAADDAKDRICIGSRISNNAGVEVNVKVVMHTEAGSFVANVLPVIPMDAGELIDDSSKLAVPIGYKVSIEADSPYVSVLMSGDEY